MKRGGKEMEGGGNLGQLRTVINNRTCTLVPGVLRFSRAQLRRLRARFAGPASRSCRWTVPVGSAADLTTAANPFVSKCQ